MAVIGWIGLGHMGGPMAAHLVEAGHEVVGFDVDARMVEQAQAGGIRSVSDAATAARDADAVFTSLPRSEHSRQVLIGDGDHEGLFDVVRPGTLVLDTSTVEVVGVSTEYGKAPGIVWGMMFGSERFDVGVQPQFVQGALPTPPQRELRIHRGEPIVLAWYAHTDGEVVRAIDRVEVEGEHVARIRNYFFTPDVLAEVCAELGVPFRSNGYLFSLSGCGQ